MEIGIAYGESVEAARELLLGLLAKDERVLQEKPADGPSVAAPVVYLASLDDSAVTLTVRAWVRSADFWGVFFDHNEEFYNAITSNPSLSFPFPQLDIHITGEKEEA